MQQRNDPPKKNRGRTPFSSMRGPLCFQGLLKVLSLGSGMWDPKNETRSRKPISVRFHQMCLFLEYFGFQGFQFVDHPPAPLPFRESAQRVRGSREPVHKTQRLDLGFPSQTLAATTIVQTVCVVVANIPCLFLGRPCPKTGVDGIPLPQTQVAFSDSCLTRKGKVEAWHSSPQKSRVYWRLPTKSPLPEVRKRGDTHNHRLPNKFRLTKTSPPPRKTRAPLGQMGDVFKAMKSGWVERRSTPSEHPNPTTIGSNVGAPKTKWDPMVLTTNI